MSKEMMNEAEAMERPAMLEKLPCNDTWQNACNRRYDVYKNYYESAYTDVLAGKRRIEQYKVRLIETYTLYENACIMSYIDLEKLPSELRSIYDKQRNYNGKNTPRQFIEVNEGDVLTELMMKYASVKDIANKLQNEAQKLGLMCDWSQNKVVASANFDSVM